jgi:thiamine biosynthesis lipoprotein
MGTRFLIQAHVAGAAQSEAIQRAMTRIAALEKLWSPWIAGSDLQRLNSAGGAAVIVEPQTVALLQRSLALCKDSGGAFDPTFFALAPLWDLRAKPFVPPTQAAIDAKLPAVGCADVTIDAKTRAVRLLRPGAQLHLGANAKGTALDAAAQLLRDAGIRDFAVDGGGDLVLSGRGPKGPWRVGIQDPRGARGSIVARLDVSDEAVATSGDNERFAEHDGKRYHHIVDPRTGWPVQVSRQVTVVVAPRGAAGRRAGERADAVATALFVMGPAAGLRWLKRHPGVDALWLDGEGCWQASPGMRRRLGLAGRGGGGCLFSR